MRGPEQRDLSSQADSAFYAGINYQGRVYLIEQVEGDVYGVFKLVARLPFGEGLGGPVPVPPSPSKLQR